MMNECPDKDTLAKLQESDLPDDLYEKTLAHLASCEDCRHLVTEMLAGEEQLLSAVLTQPAGLRENRKAGPEKCLSKKALLAYAVDSLSKDQLEQVEHHLEICDNCLTELMKLQKTITAVKDMDFDFVAINEKTSGQAAPSDLFLEIVLKAKDTVIELVRHTGELLTLTPQFAAVRGKGQKAEALIVIRKDFLEKDRSIEITVPKEQIIPGGTVKISIMSLSNESFLPGLYVKLSSTGDAQTGTTNEDGVVELSGISHGRNEIEVDGELVAALVIK